VADLDDASVLWCSGLGFVLERTFTLDAEVTAAIRMRASVAGIIDAAPTASRVRVPGRPQGTADSSGALVRSFLARLVTASRLPRARWRGRSLLVRAVRLWRTRNPRTFTEKVRYKMLRDHRQLIVTFADKAAVRDHVAALGHADLLPRAHAVLDDPDDLLGLDLPDSYVVKPTHGSGAALVISPDAPSDAVLPRPEWGWVYAHVRPEAADPTAVRDIAAGWTSKLYGRGPNEEWAYSRIAPRVIVEEKLSGLDGGIPDDFKFFVFHGTCRYVQVDAGRFDTRTQDFYDPDWQHLPLSGGPAWAEPAKEAPDRLREMVAIAERLATGTDFARVDLYLLPERIVFGELTSYPAGGHSPFHPEEWDAEFGDHWTVPRRYLDDSPRPISPARAPTP